MKKYTLIATLVAMLITATSALAYGLEVGKYFVMNPEDNRWYSFWYGIGDGQIHPEDPQCKLKDTGWTSAFGSIQVPIMKCIAPLDSAGGPQWRPFEIVKESESFALWGFKLRCWC